MTIDFRLKASVLTALSLFMGLSATAQGYEDITSEALTNPSFELSAPGTPLTAATATNITEVYGWTMPTGTSNMAVADTTTTAIGFTNGKGGVSASAGNHFLWYRRGWGNLSTAIATKTGELKPGKYYVVLDYKAADYSNNNKQSTNGTTLNIEVTDGSGSILVATTKARRAYSFANGSSNPGADTYLKDAPWTPMGAFFTVSEAGAVTITVNAGLVNNGRSDVCFDNFRLYRVYDDDASESTLPLPLDVTGTVANPSFEAGAGGTGWTNYSYNGWTAAKTADDIRAVTGDYTTVYGSQLDGLRVFNAWDGTTNDKSISQTLTGLPTGQYRLSAVVTGSTGGTFTLFAGSQSKDITVKDGNQVQTETLDFSKDDASDLQLGIHSTAFYKADNFRLLYLGKSLSQAKAEYESALALANDIYGRALDLGDQTATEKTALKAAIDAAPEQTLDGYQNAANTLRQAAQTLAQAENKQLKKTYGAEIDLGSWSNNNVTTNQGQHWDGTSTSTYYEQKDGWSQDSWSMSMTQDVTLGAGRYLLRATGRHATGAMKMSLSVNANGQTLGSVADFPAGDSGLGVNLNGNASYLASDAEGFANGGNGYGWQWRYILFTLSQETKVTIAVNGSASEKQQWMSITGIDLLREGPSQGNFDVNDTKTVRQVTTDITLDEPVDYTISSTTPFATTGSVDIVDEDAVVILRGIRPSDAEAWLPFIKVKGKAAAKGDNCSIRIYGNGSMIVPYGDFVLPLTVYTGTSLTGDAKSDFNEGSRYSLKGNIFNNKIRSFKLRRGFMVTMATGTDGKGYSRVFIADKSNRKINLPTTSRILDRHISSLRISQWNNVTKKGYAGNNQTVNSLLGTTWCYNWDAGKMGWADREYVTQHHHEGWPSIANVGDNASSANILGNNEPDNTADDKETVSSVSEVLAHWPEMMATGKRLGSPAVASNLNWLYSFIDSIDAKGYRCDFVAVHAYYYQDWGDWQNTLKAIHDRTGRPIWITEMNYGANWTGWPGSDTKGSAANYAIEKQHFTPVIDGLEATDYIERYAVYNEVQDCRKVYNRSDGSLSSKNYLTPMGEYYAGKSSRMAYNAGYGVTPRAIPMKDPALTGAGATAEGSTVEWTDPNGEFSDTILVERLSADGHWTAIASLTADDDNTSYRFTDSTSTEGTYRIHTVDYLGRHHYTTQVTTSLPDEQVGSEVTVDGQTLYMGGNQLVNGDFNFGTDGWTNGAGTAVGAPQFEVYPVGGISGGAYLQAFKSEGAASTASLKQTLGINKQTPYYFSVFYKNVGGGYQNVSLSADGDAETEKVLSLAASDIWSKGYTAFNSADYDKLLISMRWLGSTQLDKFWLAQLFPTREEAFANGTACAREEAQKLLAQPTTYPQATQALTQLLGTLTTNDEAAYSQLTQAISATRQALRDAATIDSLKQVAETLITFALPDTTGLRRHINATAQATTPEALAEAKTALRQAIDSYLPDTLNTTAISSADFATTGGWTAPAGTYTGGDQRQGRLNGRTCWNAWWNVATADAEGKTLAITQQLSRLPMGYYRLTADATTQHYCLTDQHCFLKTGSDSLSSPLLTFDRSEISGISDADRWETLSTLPVYIGENGEATIGFSSSKQNVMEGAYDTDNRAGWWLATAFRLHYTPAYERTFDEAEGWSTICLPFSARPGSGVNAYEVSGRSADGTQLFLREVTQMEAAKPYIFHHSGQRAAFLGHGEAEAMPGTGANGLKGAFHPGTIPQTAYVLSEGTWKKVADLGSVSLGHFTAYIVNFDDLPILEGGAVTMPLEGTTDGIHTPETSADSQRQPAYNIAGQRISHPQGIYIQGGKKRVRK